MAVKQEAIDKNLIRLTFEADADKVEEGLAYSYNKNKKNYNVHGFRPGKAPRKLVEQFYGSEVLFSDAEEYIITDLYYGSIPELGIKPVSYPQNVKVTKMDKEGMEFSLEVFTKPEVTLGQYKNLEITDVPSALTEEEIDNAIKSEAEKNARMVTVEDPVSYTHLDVYKRQVQEGVIRKIGHFAEFAVLGFLLMLCVRIYTKKYLQNIFIPLFGSLAAGVTDEMIQLTSSGRSSEVRDVVIDFSGAVLGIIICILCVILYNRVSYNKKRGRRGSGA